MIVNKRISLIVWIITLFLGIYLLIIYHQSWVAWLAFIIGWIIFYPQLYISYTKNKYALSVAELQQVNELLNSLPSEFMDLLRKNISSGRTMDAIKKLRKQIPGLGLDQARDVIEVIRKEYH